ncbi:hypothetical protein H6H01_06390 [Nostoc calcicola FACHB-3891]|nr:hypothetical protein [Nostoc calcicola FACHB-3891]
MLCKHKFQSTDSQTGLCENTVLGVGNDTCMAQWINSLKHSASVQAIAPRLPVGFNAIYERN